MAAIFGLAALVLTGCAGSKPAAAAARTPEVVWVVDFLLAPVESGKGGPLGLPKPSLHLPVPGDPLGRNKSADPAQRAQMYADLMAESIAADLTNAGFSPRRVKPGEVPGTTGWVVRGAFTHLDEGQEVGRAMVGFGAGAADIRVASTLTRASATTSNADPLDVGAISTSGVMPGAVVLMNPYVAAAKLVLSHGAPEREIKRIAGQISANVSKAIAAETR